jgi:DnaJ like chaperone protein
MSVWGKLGGTGLGLVLGGPLGALIGLVAGHVLVDRQGALLAPPPADVVFATGLVALSAKMAKADGVVTHDEIASFRRVVDVPEQDMPRLTRLFDLAKETSAGFESYARQVAEVLADNRPLLEDVLDGLFHIATADGAIHEAEERYLREVAGIFGFSEAEFARIEARHVRRLDDPYLVIGAHRGLSDAALKRRYRQLVAKVHPDREIARGLPPEAVRIATERLAAINAAWDRIAAERGL